MKLQIIFVNTVIVTFLATRCEAFGLQRREVASRTYPLHASSESRRVLITSAFSASAAFTLQQIFTSQPVYASDAVVDYSKIQDLLGPGGGDYVVPYQTPEEGKRPTWLTEPTVEFKESEQKSLEFKRKNLLISKQFQSQLDVVTSSPNDETVLLDALDSLRRLVKSGKGLPIGVTKEEIIKTCRRRKAKKYWPTAVEVAYVLPRTVVRTFFCHF